MMETDIHISTSWMVTSLHCADTKSMIRRRWLYADIRLSNSDKMLNELSELKKMTSLYWITDILTTSTH